MKRAIALAILSWGLIVSGANAYWQSRAQVNATTCVPFTYPGGAAYQSLSLTDSWGANDATATTNAVSSPACTVTGLLLVENNLNATHAITKGVSVVTVAVSYTYTKFYKQVTGTRNIRDIVFSSGFANLAAVGIDLGTCTTIGGGSGSGFISNTVTTVNGWCKSVLVYTGVVDTGVILQPTLLSGTTTPYLGDNTSSIGIYGVCFSTTASAQC